MRRFPLRLALPLATVVLLPLLPAAHAAEPPVSPPFWPPERGLAPEPNAEMVQVASPILRREAPAAVREAIVSLAAACAAWPKPALPSIDRVPSPTYVEMLPEDQACELVTQPGRAFTLALWFCGALGGVVTILGLVGFCFLRMVLVQLWAWRPQPRSMPQQWS